MTSSTPLIAPSLTVTLASPPSPTTAATALVTPTHHRHLPLDLFQRSAAQVLSEQRYRPCYTTGSSKYFAVCGRRCLTRVGPESERAGTGAGCSFYRRGSLFSLPPPFMNLILSGRMTIHTFGCVCSDNRFRLIGPEEQLFDVVIITATLSPTQHRRQSQQQQHHQQWKQRRLEWSLDSALLADAGCGFQGQMGTTFQQFNSS